jgi:TetR/AcrR family transcriptional regulator, transcriptional repressor for nem operon
MKERKAETRGRILASGARLMRKKGIGAASVAKVMGDAGLTVGGFYAHFKSKDDLVCEAFRHAVRESEAFISGKMPPGLAGAGRLRAFLKVYLSPQHRDADKSGQGCPFVALTSEMGKGSEAMRKAYTAELERYAADFAEGFSDHRFKIDTREFLGMLAASIGGLILARATRGSPLSDDILKASLGRLESHIEKKEKT